MHACMHLLLLNNPSITTAMNALHYATFLKKIILHPSSFKAKPQLIKTHKPMKFKKSQPVLS